jgi:hypothetical protein
MFYKHLQNFTELSEVNWTFFSVPLCLGVCAFIWRADISRDHCDDITK